MFKGGPGGLAGRMLRCVHRVRCRCLQLNMGTGDTFTLSSAPACWVLASVPVGRGKANTERVTSVRLDSGQKLEHLGSTLCCL